MQILRLINLLLCVVYLPLNSFTQPSLANIEKVLPEELTYVKAIAEDQHGFMWFGTAEGLYRFDGTHVKSYTHSREDTTTISDNNINKLFVDRHGLLWISTNDGLNCLNPLTEKCKKYFNDPDDQNSLSSNYLEKITEDRNGNIWIACLKGLNKLDPTTQKITRFTHDQNNLLSISSGRIFVTFTDHLNRFWIGTENGLDLYDPETNQFHHFLQGAPAHSLASWIIIDILEDKNGILWLATWGEGLIKFDPNTNSAESYWEAPDKRHRGDHNIIFVIKFSDDAQQYIYAVTSENTFLVFDIRNGIFIKPPAGTNDVRLKGEGQSLFLDSRRNVWIGTKGSTFKINSSQNKFSEYSLAPLLGEDCLSSVLSAYEEVDQDGATTLWLGTWTCGLIKVDYTSHLATVINKGIEQPGKENYLAVTSILRDTTGKLWIGTINGIFQPDKNGALKKIYSHIPGNSNSLSNDEIQCIFKDQDNRLWIGTHHGLNLYDRRLDHFIQYFPSRDVMKEKMNPDNIIKIVALPSGDLMVLADQKDVFKFDIAKEQFSLSLSSITHEIDSLGFVYDVILSKKQELWCAGSKGVLKIKNMFSKPEGKIYTTQQGLSFDYATGIIEDDCDHIWITTRKGLNMYDELKHTFEQFKVHDGLYSNNTEGVIIKGPTGKLIMGYIATEKSDAINFFNPCEQEKDTQDIPLMITGIKIMNRDTHIINNNSGSYLIHLRPKDRMITFEFVELNYLSPDHNKYAYKLEGFDKEWNYTGSNTTATYTNLNGGNYTFKVKSVSNLHDREKLATVALTVTPLFYKASWFYLLCILLTAGIFYLIYKLRIRQLKKLHAVRLSISHDLHDDIGSRLSSMSILTQLADQKKSDPDFNISKFYDQIQKGTKESMEIMNDIVWSVNPKYDRFGNTLIRMREYASEILEAKNIDFSIHSKAPLEDLQLTMKYRKDFYLIFKEAINNLAKYAECTMVNISLQKEHDKLILLIEDNGKGFDMASIKKGNGMHTMQTRAATLNGKLLIHSVLNQGTSVRLEMPVT